MPPIGEPGCSDRPPVVLMTGYGLFKNFTENSSQKVVQHLGKMGIENVDLRTEILSVVYSEVKKRTQELFEQHKPLLTVHCGMHSQADAVFLEQEARNSGYDQADVRGQFPDHHCCLADPKAEFLSTCLDLEAMAAQVAENSTVPVYISRDAGNYLCEFVYYCSLSRCRSTLFVHVPQISKKFTVEALAETLKRIILAALAQCGHGSPPEASPPPA